MPRFSRFMSPSKYLPYFEAAAQAAGAKATISSKSVNGISLRCISVSGIAGQSGIWNLLCDRPGHPRLCLVDRRYRS